MFQNPKLRLLLHQQTMTNAKNALKMTQITNNEGKKVTITMSLYNELLKDRERGVWCVIIRDINNHIHSVEIATI